MLCSPGPWGPLPWHKAEPRHPLASAQPRAPAPSPAGMEAASVGLGWPRDRGHTGLPQEQPVRREPLPELRGAGSLDTTSTDGLTFPAPNGGVLTASMTFQ